MTVLFYCSESGVDRGDLDRRVVLAVTVLANVVLPPTKLEDDELGAAALLDDLAGDLCTGEGRLADGDVAAVARGDEEDLVEHDLGPFIADELLDNDGLAGLDPILLTTRGDHRVHDLAPL